MSRPARLELTDLSHRITTRFNRCEANGGHDLSRPVYVKRFVNEGYVDLPVCRRCGVPIMARRPRWVSSLATRQQFDKTCAVCGVTFTTTSFHRRYCSAECSHLATLAMSRERKRIERENKSIEKVCEYCHQPYLTWKAEQRFCSMSCSATATKTKERCKRDHGLAGDNLYIDPNGHRECRTCRRMRNRRLKERAA